MRNKGRKLVCTHAPRETELGSERTRWANAGAWRESQSWNRALDTSVMPSRCGAQNDMESCGRARGCRNNSENRGMRTNEASQLEHGCGTLPRDVDNDECGNRVAPAGDPCGVVVNCISPGTQIEGHHWNMASAKSQSWNRPLDTSLMPSR